MTTTQDYQDGTAYFTPAFRIELDGRETGRDVISDVLEVSFTDDTAAIDSFEVVLNDWDPVARHPKYSSPWDENGRPIPLYEGGPDAPNFEPGAQVALYFGYLEQGELPLVMEGEVVSIAPTFPAAGSPTCRVRALDAFQRGLQKIRVEGNYDGTPKEVVDQICAGHCQVRWASLEEEGEAQENVEVDGVLYDEIAQRAQGYGLSLTTVQPEGGGEPELFLARPSDSEAAPVVELVWGRTLISFTPALSAASQIEEVEVRWPDPDAEGQDQTRSLRKGWDAVRLSPTALGPRNTGELPEAVAGVVDVITPDDVHTEAQAERAAVRHLNDLAAELITGSGSAIGLPALRTGATVQMTGLGARFDGVYRLTQTTHAIGGSGYTTNFSARKEVLDA
jgi:phage protein D